MRSHHPSRTLIFDPFIMFKMALAYSNSQTRPIFYSKKEFAQTRRLLDFVCSNLGLEEWMSKNWLPGVESHETHLPIGCQPSKYFPFATPVRKRSTSPVCVWILKTPSIECVDWESTSVENACVRFLAGAILESEPYCCTILDDIS